MNDIAKYLFDKPIEELTLDDIENYFLEPKEESDQIEYKSWYDHNQSKDLKHKESAVLKSISAFLNTNGGILIWGSPREQREGDNKIFMGPLDPVQKEYKIDTFISKIVNRIIPIPDGVKMNSVPTENGFVYIFEIKSSVTKPHQFDSRFFMRMDGQTVKAPYHYVEALFKSVKFPILSCVNVKVDYRQNFYNIKADIVNDSVYLNAENLVVRPYINERPLILSQTSQRLEGKLNILYHGEPYPFKFDFRRKEDVENIVVDIVFGSKRAPLKKTSIELFFVDDKLQHCIVGGSIIDLTN